MLYITPIQIQQELKDKGFDVVPEKQKNGMYKVYVWQGEKCHGIGKFEYKCWKQAVSKTNEDIYIKIMG